MKRYWFKVYVKDVRSKVRLQMPDWLFRRLIEFESFAAELGEEGLLPPVADMAWDLRLPDETKLSDALMALSKVGEVEETPRGWRLTHFEEKQAKVPDAERKRQSRVRHEDVTKRDGAVTDESINKSSSFSFSEERGGRGEKTAETIFTDSFGKFNSRRESTRWEILFEAAGQSRAEELIAWALRKEIHLENRAGLLDSLETAAKNWKEKTNGNGNHKRTPAEALDAYGKSQGWH